MAKNGINNSVAVGIAVQSDWDNRHFSSSLSLNVRRLFEFLLQFGKYSTLMVSALDLSALSPLVPTRTWSDDGVSEFWCCLGFSLISLGESTALRVACIAFDAESSTRSKLATLNEKLTVLERQLEFLEAQFSTAINPI